MTAETSAYDQVKGAASTMVQTFAAIANEAAAKIKAADNVNETISDLIESSDDEKVAAFRKFRDEVNARLLSGEQQITDYVKQNLVPATDNVNVEEETQTYKSALEQVKAFTKAFENLPGVTEDEVKALPQVEKVGRLGGAGKGTGTAKPRLSRILVWDANQDESTGTEVYSEKKNEDGTLTRTYTLTKLAQTLKVDPSNLRELAEAEGGAASSWKDRDGNPFTFAVAVGEGETAKNVMVKVTPQK